VIDPWPICLATTDPGEIVRTVAAIAPVFGGINLEDISAPRCFEIERRLREQLDIPFFHDSRIRDARAIRARSPSTRTRIASPPAGCGPTARRRLGNRSTGMYSVMKPIVAALVPARMGASADGGCLNPHCPPCRRSSDGSRLGRLTRRVATISLRSACRAAIRTDNRDTSFLFVRDNSDGGQAPCSCLAE
jgi:hypothetical protein